MLARRNDGAEKCALRYRARIEQQLIGGFITRKRTRNVLGTLLRDISRWITVLRLAHGNRHIHPQAASNGSSRRTKVIRPIDFNLKRCAGALLVIAGVSSALVSGQNQKTYYIDAVDGNDSAAGDSPAAAWKSLEVVNKTTFAPGDRILFHTRETWQGVLHPLGSGTASAPIVVDAYGEGDKPRIEGGGARAAVTLVDQQFWEVSHLAVSNRGKSPGQRVGVLIEATSPGVTLHHIYLSTLEVSDINGELGTSKEAKDTGGIGFYIHGTVNQPHFDDIRIQDCLIEHVDSTGIWNNGDKIVNPRSPDWSTAHNTGVLVARNKLEDIGKNAIYIRSSLAPRIEYSWVHNADARVSGNAIVVFGDQDAVIAHNEVSGTKLFRWDGAAYDGDFNSIGTVIEYNFSHDNEGGMINLCNDLQQGGFNDGAIVRYNVSQNDGERVFQFSGAARDSIFYNNTIYVGKHHAPAIVNFGKFDPRFGRASHIVFLNNIFENLGDGDYRLENAAGYAFDSNCFYGKHPSSEPADPHKVIADPGFDVTKIPISSAQDLAAYRIEVDSKCAVAARSVQDNLTVDIIGTPLPAVRGPGAVQSVKH
jgi:hypothetical protein